MRLTEESAERYVKKISANPEMSHNKILARLQKGSEVLEFGSASGAMTEVMNQEFGCHVSIVEIDSICFEHAMQYAEDGICTDIETLEWGKKFYGREFDYIIFADVLEHLAKPEMVLNEAKQLLKPDGSVLISVPNIAHNSIIIQLLKNQFIYQSTGILDYTHIRHFTYSEIERLCMAAGFSVIYMDAVYIAVGKNEFDVSYHDVEPEIAEILKKRPFGEVYQHILEIKKTEYIQEHPIRIENCLGAKKEYTELIYNNKKTEKEKSLTVNDKIIELLCENPNDFFETNHEIARLRTEINEIYLAQPQREEVAALRNRVHECQEEIKVKNQHIQRLDEEIKSRDSRIVELQEAEQSRNQHIQRLDKEIEEKNQYIRETGKQVEILEIRLQCEEQGKAQVQELLEVYRNKEEAFSSLRKDYDELKGQQIEELKKEGEEKKQIIQNLMAEIKEKGAYVQMLEEKLKEQERRNEQIQEAADIHRERAEKLEAVKKEYEAVLKITAEKDAQIQEAEKVHDVLKKTFDETCAANEKYQNKIHELQSEQERLHTSIQQQEQIKQDLEQQIRNKEGHIELLLESDRELERVKHSKSWKLMSIIWKINGKVFPAGSKRRLGGKLLVRALQHPVQSVKMLFTPRKVKNFFYYLKKDGAAFVSKRVDESFIGIKVQPETLVLEQVDEEAVKDISQYEQLIFTWQENPTVSVIIPVYNQFEYTYNCLKSILNNSGEVSYEIIIADDCSTDLTTRLTEIAENITVITNEENLRFLKNCNHAAKAARGSYLFFLNNDTQVQPNWLQPLVDLMEGSQKIGMAGSKLVYADGRLQEAGGILWRDGSAWNYGNRSNAEEPEYNYVKEVDYISGAAIMIRKELWEEIGGFDERFAPAYCEDSDLAFEVRKHGYQVVYQPLSVVVHFEGISNGTDTGSGQKAYQVINQQKFFEKWKEVLEEEHFPNAEKVFLARDRSRKKPMLLMIDHYVPEYDKDAGSRTIYQYLKMFVKQGYNVKFLGDNFYKSEPYTTILEQMGIEVLYGVYYMNNWKKWINDNSEYITYIFLNRPHISIKYIDYLRQYTNAKIVYYGLDLHYLREMRRYETTGDIKALNDSKMWKKTELNILKKVNMAYYLSNVELDALKELDSSIKTRKIPINIFEEKITIPYQPEERKGILFVGGFVHTPNVDAVKWLSNEIYPKIKERTENIELHIVGSHPTEEILALDGNGVHIHGFVTDEELRNLYASVKMVIVPLRYGAGIKGKVIEGMRYGVPVLTTSVGSEGIEGAEEVLEICDSADEIVESILFLYENNELLCEMSAKERKFVEENYSEENAIQIFGKDFDFGGKINVN